MTYVYEPSHDLRSRICRRLTVLRGRKPLKLEPGKAVVSFSFDDCPVTGIDNGVKAIENEGWLSTVYVSCGLFEIENHLGKMMKPADALALHESGHEIGEHTFSHIDATTLGLQKVQEDIDRNQAQLADLGVPASETFAYPYGETFPELKKIMGTRFKGSRGINRRVHVNEVDLNQIGSLPLYTNTLDGAAAAVKKISQSGGWLTLFTHDVRDNPSEYGCTPDTMKSIIEIVKNSGAEVLNIKSAISRFGGTS